MSEPLAALPTRPAFPARVLQISALDVLERASMHARLDQVARLSQARRQRYAVQLREPQLSAADLLSWGRELCARTREIGAMLLVNDRVDVALALGADGVHLGRHSLPARQARRLLGEAAWVTRSLHALSELHDEELGEVDGWLLSPVFPAVGKGAALGLGGMARLAVGLRERAASLGRRPGVVVALGGLDLAGARSCLAHGADAVAAIRADLSLLLAEAPA